MSDYICANCQEWELGTECLCTGCSQGLTESMRIMEYKLEQTRELCKALLSAQAHCHSVLADDGHKELLDEIERLKRDIPMFNRQAH